MRGTRRVNRYGVGWGRGERRIGVACRRIGVLACYGGEGNGVSAYKRATWAGNGVSAYRRIGVLVCGGGEWRIGALACWGWAGGGGDGVSASGQRGGEGIGVSYWHARERRGGGAGRREGGKGGRSAYRRTSVFAPFCMHAE